MLQEAKTSVVTETLNHVAGTLAVAGAINVLYGMSWRRAQDYQRTSDSKAHSP